MKYHEVTYGSKDLPMSFVGVGVSLLVISDVFSRLISGGITGQTGGARRLVDADVVEPHGSRERSVDTCQVNLRKACRHTEVHDHGQGLLRNYSLSNISVWTDCSSVELPGWDVRYSPRDLSIRTWIVVKVILRVVLSIVPVIVEIRETRHSLLKRASSVRIQGANGIVIYFHKFCCWSAIGAHREKRRG